MLQLQTGCWGLDFTRVYWFSRTVRSRTPVLTDPVSFPGRFKELGGGYKNLGLVTLIVEVLNFTFSQKSYSSPSFNDEWFFAILVLSSPPKSFRDGRRALQQQVWTSEGQNNWYQVPIWSNCKATNRLGKHSEKGTYIEMILYFKIRGLDPIKGLDLGGKPVWLSSLFFPKVKTSVKVQNATVSAWVSNSPSLTGLFAWRILFFV